MAAETDAQRQGAPLPGAAAYEPRDVKVSWVFGVVFVLILCLFGVHFFLARIQSAFRRIPFTEDRWTRRAPHSASLRPTESATHPPLLPGGRNSARNPSPLFPLLQISPSADLQDFRAREDAVLTNYGWIDQRAGLVRIPIERAMDLLVEKARGKATNLDAIGPSSDQLQQQRARESQRAVLPLHVP